MISDIAVLLFSLVMLQPGINVIGQIYASGQLSTAMRLPMFIVYIPLFVGLILSLVRLVQKYILKFTSGKNREGGLEA